MSKTYLWFKCYYATITKNSKSEQSDSREICRACYGCITLHKIERVMKMSGLGENTAVVFKESPENNLAANKLAANNLKKMKKNLHAVRVSLLKRQSSRAGELSPKYSLRRALRTP